MLEYLLAGPGPGAAARRAGQLPRRTRARSGWRAGSGSRRRRSCSSATTGSCWTTPRPGWSPSSSGAAGQHRVDASGRVRVVPRGAARPVRSLRGAAPPLGRGARQAQGAGAALQDQGGVQRRPGLAVQGRPDPAAQVRGGRAAGGAAARAAGDDAAQGRPHRQARGGLRGARADRPDAAVRPRGLVRRAGGRARLQRLRQVALPAAARGRWQRPRRRAPAGRRRPRSRRSGTPAGRSSARACGPGWFVQTHAHPELVGRTLLEILHRGDEHRDGMPREPASRALDRYELAHAAEQTLRVALRRPAGALPDPAAGAVRRDPAAARRADRQPRRRVGRGAGGGPRRGSRAPCSR